MVQPDHPPSNAFVAFARKIYNPLGFKKGYNFFLFYNLIGALMGFTLSRLFYLDIDGVFCGPGFNPTSRATPGECFYYSQKGSIDRIGIILHLATILPAAFLVCFQFVPVIRHKFILFHRINGYIILLLSLLGMVGAFMILRHVQGGGVHVQTGNAIEALMFLGALTMAYINIKRLQIEQHRAWMLRAWTYAGAIITFRPIQFLTALIISKTGPYYQVFPCAVVAYLVGAVGPVEKTDELYPMCKPYMSGENPDQMTVALADFNGEGSPVPAAASLQLGYGAGISLAIAIHAIAVEIYLHLTPAEYERLRKVSYQRQLEAGMRNPGSAGLTTDRLGDAGNWERQSKREDEIRLKATNSSRS